MVLPDTANPMPVAALSLKKLRLLIMVPSPFGLLATGTRGPV
jgi:hypothetical protein